MRTKFRVALGVATATVALLAAGLITLTGTSDTGARAAPGGVEPPGPFPDVYAPGDTYTVPGERSGTSTFKTTRYKQIAPKQPGVMDFQHYHTVAEMNWWMRKWAYEHPDIVDVYQIGESFGGVPILQLTITNKKLGKDTDKPAAYFDGGRHSGEITASESVFYMAWQLIEKYGEDADLTRLVNDKAFYIRPQVNPDGGEQYRQTAQTNRSTVRPHDTDNDGQLDEDAGEDLNDDGYVTQMRKNVGAGKGTHIIDGRDPSGMTMRRVGEGNGNYTISTEGIDNDGDGEVNEDGIGGLDLHRNYPYNWRPEAPADATGRGNTQRGAGEYPLSEPEIRSTFKFLLSHPNVGAVDSMDTNAWMILRGPSTCEEDECVFPSDLKLLKHLDKVGQAFTKYPRAGNTYRDYATQDPNPSEGSTPDPDPQPNALYGHGPDFGYFQFGAVWYGDELWNGGTMKDYNGDGQYGDWERQRWCLENGYDCFLKWTKVDHPTEGEVEVGGFNPKFFNQNGPPEVLEEWVKNQTDFNLYQVQSLPEVRIVKTKVRETSGDDGATHEMTITVENRGRIPTALEQAKRIKIVRADTVEIELPEGTGEVVGDAPSFYLKGFGREKATVRLKLSADNPPSTVTVRALSTRGGVDAKTMPWAAAMRGR